MTTSRVTPPSDEESADVEGAEGAEEATIFVRGCLGLSCAALRLTVAESMAPMAEKIGDLGKKTEKWQRIRVIAEGKMSLLQVAVFL